MAKSTERGRHKASRSRDSTTIEPNRPITRALSRSLREASTSRISRAGRGRGRARSRGTDSSRRRRETSSQSSTIVVAPLVRPRDSAESVHDRSSEEVAQQEEFREAEDPSNRDALSTPPPKTPDRQYRDNVATWTEDSVPRTAEEREKKRMETLSDLSPTNPRGRMPSVQESSPQNTEQTQQALNSVVKRLRGISSTLIESLQSSEATSSGTPRQSRSMHQQTIEEADTPERQESPTPSRRTVGPSRRSSGAEKGSKDHTPPFGVSAAESTETNSNKQNEGISGNTNHKERNGKSQVSAGIAAEPEAEGASSSNATNPVQEQNSIPEPDPEEPEIRESAHEAFMDLLDQTELIEQFFNPDYYDGNRV
ncbi:MAG: hypothetical protein Q9227_002929 [Pyrenula ochraceoflavens]